MKCRHWFFVIFSLFAVVGCSSEESHAKKVILDGFKSSTAVRFVEFTQFDDRKACYEIQVRNYDGHEQTAYISLGKDKASNKEWSDWITTKSIDECRDALK